MITWISWLFNWYDTSLEVYLTVDKPTKQNPIFHSFKLKNRYLTKFEPRKNLDECVLWGTVNFPDSYFTLPYFYIVSSQP